MAGYDADKPEGTDTIAASDDLIRSNFVQIVANISNQHVWSDDTAGDCIHNRAIGHIEKDMTDASGEDAAVALSFTPTMVLFFWIYNGLGSGRACIGMGGTDGTNEHSITALEVSGYQANGADFTAAISISSNAAVNFQSATCALSTDAFTLDWTKTGSPLSTANIFYVAFG